MYLQGGIHGKDGGNAQTHSCLIQKDDKTSINKLNMTLMGMESGMNS
jgi:hypothetical protein